MTIPCGTPTTVADQDYPATSASVEGDSGLADGQIWRPGPAEQERSRLAEFCRHTGQVDLATLDAAARKDPSWFWQSVVDWMDLDWQVSPSSVVDQLDRPEASTWFPEGAFNIADNAVDRWVRRGRGGDIALVWESEDGHRGSFTFGQLAGEVDRVGAGLLELGIGFGDTVGFQLPLGPQAAVAQLALAKIGAIAVPVFSGFGAGAVADRLRLAGAVAHIVADGFPRRGKWVHLREPTAAALAQVSTTRHTIVVDLTTPHQLRDQTPRTHQTTSSGQTPSLPGEVAWESLGSLSLGTPLAAAKCPTDHPLMIAFTSGTTGRPKGIVVGHAGFAVKAGSDAAFCFDVGTGDTAAWITDPGWVMSPITLLGGLVAGSAVALYGGAVDYPTADRLWQVVRDLDITMVGVSPTLVRSLMGADIHQSAPDLGSLRVFASSGEPWTPDAYAWLFTRIGGGHLPIINYSGGTEVSGGILSNTTIQPVHPCGFAGPIPGMTADVVNPDGQAIPRGIGELALRAPSPGMPLTFWREPGRYRSTYWDRWPGTWHHGDWVEIDARGVWFIRGRSDDTLNVAGKRLGPSEVESVASGIDCVAESAAIGVPDDLKGEALVVFVRLNPALVPDEEAVRAAVVAGIVEQLGKPLSPKAVLIVDQLPRTRSGKILRRLIRAVHLDVAVGDTSSLENPDALYEIRRAR